MKNSWIMESFASSSASLNMSIISEAECFFFALLTLAGSSLSLLTSSICEEVLRISPHFFFFTYFYFIDSFLVMWSSCDHIVTYCTCDGYCSVTSIVLWPIVQGDSFVPVMAIVLVTLLFSLTICHGRTYFYLIFLYFIWIYLMKHSCLSPYH